MSNHKTCATCRWCGCRNYGREVPACDKYIMSLEEKRRISIESCAKSDLKTSDREYNKGLDLILKHGYNRVWYMEEVRYYCMCNNL